MLHKDDWCQFLWKKYYSEKPFPSDTAFILHMTAVAREALLGCCCKKDAWRSRFAFCGASPNLKDVKMELLLLIRLFGLLKKFFREEKLPMRHHAAVTNVFLELYQEAYRFTPYMEAHKETQRYFYSTEKVMVHPDDLCPN